MGKAPHGGRLAAVWEYRKSSTDVTKLYVYDMDGKKICEAVSAELLAFGPHCSQAALEKHGD